MPDEQSRLVSTPKPEMTAADAAASIAVQGAVGFAYSPRSAVLMACGKSGWMTAYAGQKTEEPMDFSDVYELRCFDGSREIVWIQTGGGLGTAFDRTESVDGEGPVAFGAPQTHLLWGQVNASRDTPPGWASTESARVGAILVPVGSAQPASGTSLHIQSQEYADADDEGNVYIADIRYLAVGVITGGAQHG